MHTRTIFICDLCKTEYTNKREAMVCGHKPPRHIVEQSRDLIGKKAEHML